MEVLKITNPVMDKGNDARHIFENFVDFSLEWNERYG